MPKLRVAVQLASLGLPFKKALHTAAEMGADAVEIDGRGEVGPRHLSRTGLREVRKMLDDLNLRVCALTYRTRRGYHVADDLDRRIEGTKQALRFAYELGAAVVVNQIGDVPIQPEGAAWTLLVQSLTEIGRYGQQAGAMLAAVTGAEAGTDLARLIHALPPATLGVAFDPGNLIINGFSASDGLNELAPHVVHVHVRDAVRDLTRGRGLEMPVGRGSVDFPQLIGALEQQGFRGYWTIVRSESNDVREEIRMALHYLRSL